MPANTQFHGKTFSILGDSISTLKGYLPPYCKAFYMQNPHADCSGVARPEDTWWMQVISALQGNLCVNNSFSGSLVSGIEFPCATHLLRCSELHCGTGSYWFSLENGIAERILCRSPLLPEIILIYMGTNDWIFRSPLDGAADRRDSFRSAYDILLYKIRRKYPDSRIVCATLFQKDDAVPDALHPIAAYNDVIRKLAGQHGCILADIAAYDADVETIDGIHPTYQGMHTLSDLWLRSLTNQQNP